MRRNRRCPLLRRDTCAQNRSLYVRKEEMIKGPYLRTLSALGPFLPVHWLEWKRWEGHGKASLSSRSAG